MLQQTRVEAVKPYYANFMGKFPTLEALANADDEEVLKAWEGLGIILEQEIYTRP